MIIMKKKSEHDKLVEHVGFDGQTDLRDFMKKRTEVRLVPKKKEQAS
jgi:hypothetical protein